MDIDEAEISSGSDSDASSLASYVEPIANSVTLKRAKRTNAGANLKTEIARYKGEEKRDNKDGDDEEFWNQDFFKSDDEEFSEGDLSDEDKVDKYDSDFNDSEASEEDGSDEVEEEEGGGKRKNIYQDPSGTKKRKKYKAAPMIGKRLPPSKTAGTGINRGLTLGSAASSLGVLSASELLARKEAKEAAHTLYCESQGITAGELLRREESAKNLTKPKHAFVSDMRTRKKDSRSRSQGLSSPSLASSPSRSSGRDGGAVPGQRSASKSSPPRPRPAKRVRSRITQESLLSECVLVTEPLNKKWLMGRRRMTDANEKVITKAKRDDLTNVKQRFTSKGKIGVGGQGMFNCITFPKV
ncbi:hypothetical protein TrRE_jg1100, partial [Triparma retinervis]